MARTKHADSATPPINTTATTPRTRRAHGTLTLDQRRDASRSLSDPDRAELLRSLGIKAEREVKITIYDGQQRERKLNTWEAANCLGVTVERVEALIREGRLPAQKVGRDFIINPVDLKRSGLLKSAAETPEGRDEERPDLISRPRADDIDHPRAVVIFGPRGGTERQEIDILASVRADAANIGHPAILCAIRFWEGSVICRSRLSGMGRGEGARLAKCGKIAETHLQNLGKVLLQGAREKSRPANYAFDVYRGVFDMNFYLKLVFEAFCKSGSREPGALIEMVFTRLSQDELCEDGALRTAHSPEALEILDLGFEYIRDFLESDIGRAAFKRRQLKRWENLYDEWRFALDRDVQRRYRGSAAAETSKPLTHVGAEALWPDTNRNTLNHPVVLSPDRNWYTVSATGAAFNLPVVLVMKK